MKKSGSILLTLCLGTLCFAQTGSFKKILNEKSSMDREVFYEQLLQFQKENVDFSNVYYQLGKVELEMFSSLDPIVERVASRQRIYNAKTNFGLAKNYLDDREVSRFPGWYDVPDLSDKDSVTSMGVKQIEQSHEGTENYAKYYEELIDNYDRAVYHYLKAREGFIDINTSADNLRQLFLKADDSLKYAVKSVGLSFDSSMYHVDIYRQIYQQLPHKKKREVNIRKRKIDHFRMNGITPANFLADNIEVWDYRQWSDRFLNLLRIEVDGLQNEIKSAYQFFMATNDKMIHGEDCIQAELDNLKFQRIINLITKYDNESVLIDIFQYLISKLEYGNKLTYERNCNQLDVSLTDDYFARKVRIYQSLFTSFQKADSLDAAIASSGHGQESFQWFFDEMMPGEKGSANFAEEQKSENYQSFKEELVGLMQSMDDQNFMTDSISACFSVDSVFLLSGALPEGNFCASRSLQLNSGLELFIGKLGEENRLLGAIPNDEDYEKEWEVKPYKNSEISYFKTVGDSTFIMGGISGKAWLSQISTSGDEYFTTSLKSGEPIQDVMVNQLQGIATVVQGSNGNYTLTRVNFNGKMEATKSFILTGDYVGMIRQEQTVWFFSHSATAEGSKITASIYDEESGGISQIIEYKFEALLEKPSIVKNDNEYFTLLALSSFSEDEIVYALMNYEGEIEHETIF